MDSTTESSQPQICSRGKTDPAWAHRRQTSDSSKKNLVCMYCEKLFKGGGKVIKGDTEPCKKVPPEVSQQLKLNIEETASRKKRAQDDFDSQDPYADEDVQEIPSTLIPSFTSKGTGRNSGLQKKKAQKATGLGSSFVPRTTPGSQPTIRSVLQTKEAEERVDIAVSKWMIDACIPFNAVNSMYYRCLECTQRKKLYVLSTYDRCYDKLWRWLQRSEFP